MYYFLLYFFVFSFSFLLFFWTEQWRVFAHTYGMRRYLMDKEEKEDVFTVSVGNLPPNAECIIKVRTFDIIIS